MGWIWLTVTMPEPLLPVLLLTLVLGTVYIFTSAPRYTAHAILVIDTHKPQFLQSDPQMGVAPIDSAAVDTQIEILNSENVALSVIKDLHLNEDPEFISPSAGFLGTIANLATEDLSHPNPVFHGDTLYAETEVLEKRESRSKPDRGTVAVFGETPAEAIKHGRIGAMLQTGGLIPLLKSPNPANLTTPTTQATETNVGQDGILRRVGNPPT